MNLSSHKKMKKEKKILESYGRDDDIYDNFLYVEWKAGSYPKLWTLNSIFLHPRNQCQFIMLMCYIYYTPNIF